MKKITLLIFISLCFILPTKAQDITVPNFTPTSPEAATFLRYGEIPVDFTTGVTNIEIPIYTIKMNGMEIPITISYHSGGFRNNDASSVVGLGWVLNCGGNITRQVIGMADSPSFNFNLYGGVQELLDEYIYKRSIKSEFDRQYEFGIYEVFSGWRDTHSDRYYYRLNNTSGYFRFDMSNADMTPKPVPFSNIKIERSNRFLSRLSTDCSDFNIIDETGAKYIFNNPDMVESGIAIKYPFIWKPGKIITPNKLDSLCYEYNDYVFRSYEMQLTCFHNSDYSYPIFDPWPGVMLVSVPCPNSSKVPATTGWSRNYMQNHLNYLKKLQSNNIVIEFDYSESNERTQSKKLDMITVKDIDGNIIRRIQFYHSYFGTGNAVRLRLDAVSFNATNSSPIEKYEFEYNDGSLPLFERYGHGNYWYDPDWSEDYWGYPGRVPTSCLIPDGTTRDVNPNAYNNCLLKKITYPTKGYSVFEYEANKGKNNRLLSGARIKKITNVSQEGKQEIKQYLYDIPNHVDVNINHFTSQPEWVFNAGGYLDPYETYYQICSEAISNLMTIKSSSPVYPIHNPGGTIVTYDKVEEILGDGTNLSGKTTYYFNSRFQDNWDEIYAMDDMIRLDRIEGISEYHYDKGLYQPPLTRKEVYAYNNGRYDKVEETKIDYTKLKRGETFYTGLSICKNNTFTMLGLMENKSKEFVINHYQDISSIRFNSNYSDSKAFQDIHVKDKETTISYLPNGNITQIKQYYYKDGDYEPVYVYKEEITNSNNVASEKIIKYSYELSGAPYTEMQNRNMLQYPVSIKQTTNNSTLEQKVGYQMFGNNILPSSYSNYVNDVVAENMVIENYDIKGNPAYITKSGIDKIVYIWGYGGQYPIAEIIGVPYLDIVNILGQTLINRVTAATLPADNDLQAINSLRTNNNLSNALVTTYTYKPLVGIRTSTDPRGVITYYEYDTFQRLNEVYYNENGIINPANKRKVEDYYYKYKNQ